MTYNHHAYGRGYTVHNGVNQREARPAADCGAINSPRNNVSLVRNLVVCATRLHARLESLSNVRNSECRGEVASFRYLKACTHRPSHHGSS